MGDSPNLIYRISAEGARDMHNRPATFFEGLRTNRGAMYPSIIKNPTEKPGPGIQRHKLAITVGKRDISQGNVLNLRNRTMVPSYQLVFIAVSQDIKQDYVQPGLHL